MVIQLRIPVLLILQLMVLSSLNAFLAGPMPCRLARRTQMVNNQRLFFVCFLSLQSDADANWPQFALLRK